MACRWSDAERPFNSGGGGALSLIDVPAAARSRHSRLKLLTGKPTRHNTPKQQIDFTIQVYSDDPCPNESLGVKGGDRRTTNVLPLWSAGEWQYVNNSIQPLMLSATVFTHLCAIYGTPSVEQD
jgi:hypothetical protein